MTFKAIKSIYLPNKVTIGESQGKTLMLTCTYHLLPVIMA